MYNFVFVPEPSGHPIQDSRLIQIHFYAIANPLQADRGFATDEVSFSVTIYFGYVGYWGDGGWWIEESGERSAGYKFSQPPESYVEICTSFYLFQDQMTDQLGRLLDPYPTASLFVHFPSSYAPAPVPLPLTHLWQRYFVLVWCNLPGEPSTRSIIKQCKNVNFIVFTYG